VLNLHGGSSLHSVDLRGAPLESRGIGRGSSTAEERVFQALPQHVHLRVVLSIQGPSALPDLAEVVGELKDFIVDTTRNPA
jgi:hypothetical protein